MNKNVDFNLRYWFEVFVEPVIQTFECVSGLLNFQTSPWCLGEAMKFTESLLLLLKSICLKNRRQSETSRHSVLS